MAVDLKFGTLDIPGVPADEPVFVIRGQDKLALGILDEYIYAADDAGCHEGVGDGVQKVKDQFRDWQRENGSKRPD